jgi:hypothetical protein
MAIYTLYIAGIEKTFDLELESPPNLSEGNAVLSFRTRNNEELTVRREAIVAFTYRSGGDMGKSVGFKML